MTAAIFALIGTLLGTLGAVATQLIGTRAESARSRREDLRLACADLAAAVARIRELSIELIEHRLDSDPDGWASIREAHLEARVHYERLRLISSSFAVQKTGRHVLRYSYGMIRQAQGIPPREDEREVGPFVQVHVSLMELYGAVRRELGVPRADLVFREPDSWLGPAHITGAKTEGPDSIV
jgi:hypothetical protein